MAGPPANFAVLLRARRGFLGTVGSEGDPHVLPVCFIWAGDEIYTAVDSKPKSTGDLQRLKDIEANPRVCFAVDRWDEDWQRLAWLQARGNAHVLTPGADTEKAYAALKDKYEQYREIALEGPVIRIDVERWVAWQAEPKEG